jgi:hypothetical protein
LFARPFEVEKRGFDVFEERLARRGQHDPAAEAFEAGDP